MGHRERGGMGRPFSFSDYLAAKACPELFGSAQDKLRRRDAKFAKAGYDCFELSPWNFSNERG